MKNNQVDSPKSDSKEVNPAPDESTNLFHELKASRQREKKSTSCFVFSSLIIEQGEIEENEYQSFSSSVRFNS